jgi:dienelactone hydrolase
MNNASQGDGQPAREDIETKARRLVGDASAGRFDAASSDFDPKMREGLPPAKLEEVWKQIEKGAGRFQAIEKVDLETKQDMRVVLATARFERTSLVVKVVFDPEDRVAGLFFQSPPVPWSPPAYADPQTFEESSVEVGASPALPGTLTLPKGAGPFPAVVLVHGSGPNDRDETVGGQKPFKDLAWGLASKGVAVLRYEKRSRHAPAGIVTQKEEVLDAVRDAVELLGKTSSIDPKRIFVLGHSQGGYLAPRIGAAHPQLAGLVILAGSTRPLEDSMIEQLEYLSSLAPNDAGLTTTLQTAREFKAKVGSASLRAEDTVTLPTGGSVTGAYFLDVRGYEPHTEARKLALPMLVLQGDRDYQVTQRDFDGWKTALSSKKNATLRTYSGLNHLFATGEGTPSPADYRREGHVDAKVVDDIAAWLKAQPRR